MLNLALISTNTQSNFKIKVKNVKFESEKMSQTCLTICKL